MRLLKACGAVVLLGVSVPVRSADHLDTPTVIADPAADIGDVYAWMSPDRRHLNLVLDLFGPQRSDAIDYRFHVDSGPRHGARTRARADLVCRFAVDATVSCRGPRGERVRGDAGGESGLTSRSGRLRVYSGRRNDPFFNNVNGTRWAYAAATAALAAGAARDAAGCPRFDALTSREIRRRWAATSDGSATDFLRGWKVSALVLQIDLQLVDRGGPLLAVWATTVRRSDGRVLDRMGRPLTENALLGPLDPETEVNARKEAWNRAAPSQWPDFAATLARTLALYDGFDGDCGNQWQPAGAVGRRTPLAAGAARRGDPAARYRALAGLLADDRLWIDSRHSRCGTLLAVERGIAGDCGGRAPSMDAPDQFRSLLMDGSVDGLPDGADRDDGQHSDAVFPFLGAP